MKRNKTLINHSASIVVLFVLAASVTGCRQPCALTKEQTLFEKAQQKLQQGQALESQNREAANQDYLDAEKLYRKAREEQKESFGPDYKKTAAQIVDSADRAWAWKVQKELNQDSLAAADDFDRIKNKNSYKDLADAIDSQLFTDSVTDLVQPTPDVEVDNKRLHSIRDPKQLLATMHHKKIIVSQINYVPGLKVPQKLKKLFL